jgi:hypothetical protein
MGRKRRLVATRSEHVERPYGRLVATRSEQELLGESKQ